LKRISLDSNNGNSTSNNTEFYQIKDDYKISKIHKISQMGVDYVVKEKFYGTFKESKDSIP